MDMLVALYDLPPAEPLVLSLLERGVIIRRANPWEVSPVREFITRCFSLGWADEASVGFARTPVSTYVAVQDGALIGFGSYECTCRAFFGPTGVEERFRKQGVGTALLLRCLEGLAELGYGYGIIGSAGPTAFYENACGATAIPNSSPGIYRDLLKRRG
jgi:GNAT superfamily N-acetyltransferase